MLGQAKQIPFFFNFYRARERRVEQKRFFSFAEPHCSVRSCVVCVGGARCKAEVLAVIGLGGGSAVA